MSDHPHYPNDTIREALCEFKLNRSPDFQWKAKTSVAILNALDPNEFPGMEPVSQINWEIQINKDTGHGQQTLADSGPRFKYSNHDESKIVQVAPNIFVYNQVGKYPGWASMQSDLLQKWERVQPHILPERVERIGLRYINEIPVGQDGSIFDWICPNEFIPSVVGNSKGPLRYRIDVSLAAEDRAIVMLIREQNRFDRLFLDIDRIRYVGRIPSVDDLRKITDTLHEDIWKIFSDSQTSKFSQHLNKSS